MIWDSQEPRRSLIEMWGQEVAILFEQRSHEPQKMSVCVEGFFNSILCIF